MDNPIYIDDLPFIHYMNSIGGLQCRIDTPKGSMSIRRGGHGLFTDDEHPYEVWYPDQDTPSGYQTADNIWNYIKTINNG